MKKKWYQKTWVKIVGALFVLALIGNVFMPNPNEEVKSDEATNNSKYYVNIFQIANKTLDSVQAKLGKGELIDKIKDTKSGCSECPKYSFRNGDVEIVFINGMSDWITINNMDASFSNCSIDMLGPFDCINRSLKTDVVMRWHNVKGFREIALFRKYEDQKPTTKVSYAYIKTNSE